MDLHKLKKNHQVEIDAGFLYESVANAQQNEKLKKILMSLANIEHQHGARIFEKIHSIEPSYQSPTPSVKAKIQVKIGKYFGYRTIMSMLGSIERQLADNLVQNKLKNNETLTGTEHNHVEIIDALSQNETLNMTNGLLSRFERRHNSVDGNALRAAVLGANDGLLSNLSLIMGVVGAASSSKTIILTGIAGLLAGAISMALGEWISVQNSRELYQYQIDQEMEELEAAPEEEKQELALLYQLKGMDEASAIKLAEEKFLTKESALDALITEELNIDKHELGGSAWDACIASFCLFAFGAVIPLFPYFFLNERYGFYTSIITTIIGLFGIGSATTLFTGKNVMVAGIRQILFGLCAAIITYSVGHFLGVALS